MASFTVQVAFYFLSFISSLVQTLAMSVIGINEIEEGNCSYTPQHYTIPCKQYQINSRTYCTEDWLSKQYPTLYNTTESGTAYLPGNIVDIDARTDVISWRAPEDASIHYLKGFYIELIGNSFQNVGMKLCTVVDLSSSSSETIKVLTNATFNLNVTAAGDFLVKIGPLPPRPNTDKPKFIEKQPIPLEYHPHLQEESIEYVQINGSCINLTVVLEPEIENINQLHMEVVNIDGKLEENLTQNLEYPMPFYIINGFRPGNFSLWVRPVDEYSGDSRMCVCYEGTKNQRYCVVCREIGKFVQIKSIEERTIDSDLFPETEPVSSLPVILGAVAGIVAFLFVLFMAVFFFLRQHALPQIVTNFSHRRRSVLVDDGPKLNVVFMFASDNATHVKTIQELTKYVNSFDFIRVMHLEYVTSPTISRSSLNLGEFQHSVVLEQADAIVIVHSEWAKALYDDMKMRTVYASEAPSSEDCRFISCMHQIKQCHYSTKLVSLRFVYTPESAVIKQIYTGPMHSLPSELSKFVSLLYSKSGSSNKIDLNQSNTEFQNLIQAINSCAAYQRKNCNWFAKKLFILKTYVSSDDSGIVTQRKISRCSRSTRSRSADTISSGRWRFDDQCHQPFVRTCIMNQSKRSRALSCDLSFSPPESEMENQSLGYSIMEHKFQALNEKYEYILNYKLEADEDCFTIDGKSV